VMVASAKPATHAARTSGEVAPKPAVKPAVKKPAPVARKPAAKPAKSASVARRAKK
jgi:hypothetical protein